MHSILPVALEPYNMSPSNPASSEPHPAPHPRQGAVDMISFMPLSELSSADIRSDLSACDDLAWRLGQNLGDGFGCPVLMYGPRAKRSLVETRRGTSFFRSVKASAPREAMAELPLDFPTVAPGAAVADDHTPGASPAGLPQRSGVTIIGVQPYVTNFNICVAGAELDACKAAASLVRTRFGVQVMALPHAGETVEIGCNLQASEERHSPNLNDVLAAVSEVLPAGATIVNSYVVGLTPGQASEVATQQLSSDGQ